MARFKFIGLEERPGVHYGPLSKIRVKMHGGQIVEMLPKPPATEFVKGTDIGYDITDQRVLRHMRIDARLSEIV
jgi:hypothetical protein